MNTRPVIAHKIPTNENTTAVPSTNKIICKRTFNGLSLEYPPMYPIIIGSMDRVQGVIEASTPPKKEIISSVKP